MGLFKGLNLFHKKGFQAEFFVPPPKGVTVTVKELNHFSTLDQDKFPLVLIGPVPVMESLHVGFKFILECHSLQPFR